MPDAAKQSSYLGNYNGGDSPSAGSLSPGGHLNGETGNYDDEEDKEFDEVMMSFEFILLLNKFFLLYFVHAVWD